MLLTEYALAIANTIKGASRLINDQNYQYPYLIPAIILAIFTTTNFVHLKKLACLLFLLTLSMRIANMLVIFRILFYTIALIWCNQRHRAITVNQSVSLCLLPNSICIHDFYRFMLVCLLLLDMFDMVLKFGSYIVDGLREYRQPVLIYIPPFAELRGGAWVVLDTKINPEYMEMYADKESRLAWHWFQIVR